MPHNTCTINSGGRTPGSKLPASPPPLPRPDGGGNPWPCTCVHGPSSSGHTMDSTIRSETSTITRHGDASTRTAHRSRRVSAVCRRRARGHDSCSGIDGATVKVSAWTRTSHCTSHSKLELPEACSYPCHAQKAGITHRWSVVCCQEG